VPVSASSITSLPSLIIEIHSDWIGVGVLTPFSFNLFIISSDIPNSLKFIIFYLSWFIYWAII
jgi:hypothetical protein